MNKMILSLLLLMVLFCLPITTRHSFVVGSTARLSQCSARGPRIMSELSESISKAVRKLGDKVRKYRERGLNEDNTKASLLDPMLLEQIWIRKPEGLASENSTKGASHVAF